MKKLFSGVILSFILLSQLQVMQVYANGQQVLENEKQKGEQTLDAMEGIIDNAVEKLDDKIKDEQQSEQLQEKHEEIGEYLEQVQEDIANENSGADVKELVEEAKKVVVLKVVSGVTEYDDVQEHISSDVADTPDEIVEAVETIQDSLETESGEYSLIVRTKYSKKKVSDLFERFDDNTRIENMYESDGKEYFEVFLKEDSIFKQEMLEDIESGILPETFLGIEIVLPEVYSIETQANVETQNLASLQGEDLSKTWGITRYQSYKYFDATKENSQKIRVGVVDTGIDYNHPDLKNNVNRDIGKDFVNEDDDAYDDQGHGTHVAGTIAANINGAGIIGVNPYVELVPLKICTNRGFCPSYAVLRALDYAKEKKIDILNMSLGGRGNPKGHAICAGISGFTQAGGIVVAASGNSNIDTSRFVPGGCSDAITVAAIDSSDMRAPFSNYGNKVDVAAPGVQVYSTYPVNKGSYKKLSGTSMATPHIVGIVSLMQAYNPNITSAQIKAQFTKYPQSVQTDRDYKTIAKAINLEGLIASYSVIPTTPVVQTEAESIKTEPLVENTNTRDDSTLDPDITWTSDEDLQKKREALDQQEEPEPSSVEIQSLQLNIGDENIKINSLGDESYEREEIDMQLVEQKESSQKIPEKIIYDALGNPVDSGVEINSNNSTETFGVEIGEDFDFENLPELVYVPSEGVEINSSEEDEEPETQELLIDGAEAGVKINSSAELGEQLTFFTGAILIEEESFSGELLEVGEETIDYSYDEEIFIDGAEKGVEINAAGGEEETLEAVALEEYDPSIESQKLEAIEGEDIIGYSAGENAGVEINSTSDASAQEGEIIEIIQNQEVIEVIEYSGEDVLIDGAEKGVEINSVGDEGDVVPEELQLEEYDEMQLPELEDISGEQIDLEYMPEEQMPIGPIPDEIVEVDAQVESIDEIDDNGEDLFLEGAESGVEINSLGEDEGPEEVNEEEYLETIESEKNDIEGETEEEIETPDELLNDEEFNQEDEIGEDEIIEGEFIEFDEDAEEVESEEGGQEDAFGIQNTYYCTIEQGQWCSFRIYKPYYYRFYKSNSTITLHRSYKRSLNIQGLKSGRSIYKMYYGNRHYHTIYIHVKSPPKPKDIYVNLELGASKNVYLPVNRVYYKYSTRNRWYYTRGNAVYTWSQGKNYTIDVTKGGRTLYRIHVKQAPKKVSAELMVGQQLTQSIPNAYWYKYSFSSSGKVDIRTYRSTLYITGKSAGNTKIYVKHPTTGAHLYTIDVKVKEAPKPKEYSLVVEENKYIKLYLPRDDQLYLYRKNLDSGNVGVWDNRRYHGYLNIRGYTAGNVDYYLKDSRTGLVKYLVHIKIIPKPPVIINMEMYEGQKTSSYLYYASSHQYTFSHSSYVSTSASSRYLYITGKKAGNIKIYAKKDGIHRYTINVKIKALPKPKEHHIKIQEKKETYIYLGKNTSYRPYSSRIDNGNAYMYSYYGWVKEKAKITGSVPGKMRIYLRDKDNVTQHIFHITITAIPPEIRTLSSIYETGYVSVDHNNLIPSVSKTGYLSLYKSSSTLHIRGLKAGKVEIYMKDGYGRHTITYKLEVKPKPKPKVYNLNFTGGNGSANVYLPDYIRNYYVSREGDSIYDNLRQYDKHFWIDVERVGSSRIVLRDKKHRFERYIINVVSEPSYEDYTLHVGDNIDVWYHSRYDFREQDNSIVDYSERGRDSTLVGKKVGKTEIHIFKYGNLKKIWRVNVTPQPKRITVNCTTQVRDDCELRVPNSGYYRYTNIPSSDLTIESTSKKIEVSAKTSGTVIVYVRAAHGNYITHIFQVFIKARQADVESCEIPSNRSCETYPIADRHNYTIKVSKAGVVRAYGNILRDANQRKTDKAKLIIEGVSPGYAEVYLYHGRDHVATIKTTVSGPADSITVDDRSIELVAGGESKKINILTGGGKYTIKSADTDQLSISVKTNADNTGVLTLKGLKHANFVERNYYPEIRDQWGEVKQLKVKLLAPEMELDEDQITLGVGQSKTIKAKNLTGKIATLSRNNNNISITKLSGSSFKITGKATGFATAGATDTGGGYDSVFVEVRGTNNSQDNSSGNTKIRYIRDWINGSNMSSSNAWSEISVIEKNTGVNRAKGVIPTTDIISPTGKLSYLTDGIKSATYSLWTGKSSAGKLNYMQLDLGELYDIEAVKVVHFFTDGRTFKETKTEVSADGVTWHTLYDSAVSGTYIEPKDGSGRSYTVEIESGEGKIKDKGKYIETLEGLENFLQNLLNGKESSSVQNANGNSIEINNIGELSLSLEDRIDIVVQKFYKSKGKKISLEIKDILLEKASSYNSPKKEVAYGIINSIAEIDKGLYISDVQVTTSIDEGYMGGIYFESNIAVQEAGFETIYNNSKAFSSSNTSDESVGKIHASILLPECLESCSFGIRGYVQDFLGRKTYTDIYSVSYVGGEKIILDNTDFQITSFSETGNSIEVANAKWVIIKKAIHGVFLFVGLIDTAICSVIDNVGCGINIVGGIVQGMGNKTKDVVRGTYKRVLKLANKKDVDTLAQDLGKNVDELEEVLKTPGGNPVRLAISKVNTKLLSKDDVNKYVITPKKFLDDGYIFYKTELGRESRYIISISPDNKTLVLHDVFKGNIDLDYYYASNALYDMLDFIGHDKKIDTIKIDKLINLESVDDLIDGKDFLTTRLGKTTKHLIEQLGLKVSTIDVSDLIYDSSIKYGKYFDITINL